MSLLNGTMIPIYTTTVGAGGQASIQFSNIPQTYTDLKIVLSGRTTNASLADSVYLSFNSSTSNFSSIILYGDGTSGSSFLQARYAGSQPGSTATASIFSNIEIYISNYTSSNNKPYSVEAISDNNGTTGYLYAAGGLWSNSAAISSITLTPNAGTFLQHTTATLYGVKSYVGETGGKAIGGTVTSDANYWYHVFTTSGMFTPTQNLTVEYLVVAGGAGGGTNNGGGGGGAGGIVYNSSDSLTTSSYSVTVGAGGSLASDGNNSIFRSSTALKGGRGGNSGGAGIGGSGTYGSGGGNGRDSGSSSGGAGTSGQGFAGGGPATGTNANGGGGGGGAGGTGYPGKEDSSANNGGLGGIGTSSYSSWGLATSTGENVNGTYYYAGGGGGSPVTGNALGGSGGGGRSATFSLSGLAATSGIFGTGGGGGGGGSSGNWSSAPGNGGSGIVIIRYAK